MRLEVGSIQFDLLDHREEAKGVLREGEDCEEERQQAQRKQRVHNQMSSCSNKRSLNSRYGIQTRSKAPGLRKITLTDLCPEEKGKVGELILLIEKHRQDNQILETQNHTLQLQNQQLNEKMMRLEFEATKQEHKIKEMTQVLGEYEQHISKREEEFQKYEKKIQKILVDKPIQVEMDREVRKEVDREVRREVQPVEVKESRSPVDGKQRPTSVQIQTQQHSHSPQKKPKRNSQAFKKIMNGLVSISKAVDDKLNRKSQESIHSSALYEEQEQDFSNLARIWLKIKKENAGSHLKSKESQNLRPFRSIQSVEESEDYSKLLEEYRKMRGSETSQLEEGGIDPNSLNLMLKKGNFRANEVLRSTGRGERELEKEKIIRRETKQKLHR